MKQENFTANTFITSKPASRIISPYISYYYFDSSEDNKYQRKFVFYPNYKHALTAYKSSEVKLTKNQSIVRSSSTMGIHTFYSINKDKNIKV